MPGTLKGYWVGYSYMGYVGKDYPYADKNGYMEFASEEEYRRWFD